MASLPGDQPDLLISRRHYLLILIALTTIWFSRLGMMEVNRTLSPSLAPPPPVHLQGPVRPRRRHPPHRCFLRPPPTWGREIPLACHPRRLHNPVSSQPPPDRAVHHRGIWVGLFSRFPTYPYARGCQVGPIERIPERPGIRDYRRRIDCGGDFCGLVFQLNTHGSRRSGRAGPGLEIPGGHNTGGVHLYGDMGLHRLVRRFDRIPGLGSRGYSGGRGPSDRICDPSTRVRIYSGPSVIYRQMIRASRNVFRIPRSHSSYRLSFTCTLNSTTMIVS